LEGCKTKIKIIEITETDCCKECPYFDYEDGKGMCYDRDVEIETENSIDKGPIFMPFQGRLSQAPHPLETHTINLSYSP
jgi:hypothetical protein